MCCDVHVMPGGRHRIVIIRIWLERSNLRSTDPEGVTCNVPGFSPNYIFACFSSSHHHDIMHHITLNILQKKNKILFYKPIFVLQFPLSFLFPLFFFPFSSLLFPLYLFLENANLKKILSGWDATCGHAFFQPISLSLFPLFTS